MWVSFKFLEIFACGGTAASALVDTLAGLIFGQGLVFALPVESDGFTNGG